MIDCLIRDHERPIRPLRGFAGESIAAALESGRLDLSFCCDCHLHQFPPAPVCNACGGRELSPRPASGRAILYSFTRVHAAPGALAEHVPYPIGLVDLEEGVRLMVPLIASRDREFVPDEPMRLLICRHPDGPVLAACPADAKRADLIV